MALDTETFMVRVTVKLDKGHGPKPPRSALARGLRWALSSREFFAEGEDVTWPLQYRVCEVEVRD